MLLPAFGFLVLAAGCTVMRPIDLEVLAPARVTVPREIQTLVLGNRYQPEGGRRPLQALEGFLSGEWIGQDRKGMQACLSEFTAILADSPRFRVVGPPLDLRGSGYELLPEPLLPADVQRICGENGADALTTVESFDSNVEWVSVEVERRRKNEDGEWESYTDIERRPIIDVNVGWRMYDGRTGVVLDEVQVQQQVKLHTSGGVGGAVRQIGRVAAAEYASRISPYWTMVRRLHFFTGNDRMKAASRLVRAGDWDTAQQIWRELLEDPDAKIRGKAAYNLAVAHEAEGDLQGAVEWATKAAVLGEREAPSYLSDLNRRLADEERLDVQLEAAPE